MNPPQGEVVPIATTSQPAEETHKLTRLIGQTNKKLLVPNYIALIDESVKLVLSTFAVYELNHESRLFSVNDSMDLAAYLVNVSTAVQNPNIMRTLTTIYMAMMIHEHKK